MHKVTVPRHHVNDDSAILLNWYVKNGSRVHKGDKIAELESTKASYDVEAPEDGIVSYSLNEKAEISVGSLLCIIADKRLEPLDASPAPVKIIDITLSNNEPAPISSTTRFSPKAKALIQKYALDANIFIGRGLVKSSDVEALIKRNTSEDNLIATVPTHVVEMSRAKKFEAKNLNASSKAVIPSSVTVSCDTVGFRNLSALKDSPASASAIIIFEVSRLLKKYPLLNGFYDGDKCYLYDEINIGFAMDAGNGLKVPVVKGADQKSIQSIQVELDDLVLQYLEERLDPSLFAHSTFTITDLSAAGVVTFSPVINFKQSAILGIGSENLNASSGIGSYQLILGFDHQLSSGKEAAAFLTDLKTRLEGYEAMLLSLHADNFFSCSQCLRTLSELNANGAHLLQVIQAAGKVKKLCSFCLGGW